MAVQITSRQIADAAIDVDKLDLSTGTFDFTSAVLQVAAPSNGSDAATKTYVDNIAQGLHWKESVRVASTGDLTLSGTQTIDGIAVVAGDRVLVKNQTDQTENGIYVCASGAWDRADDMDASSEFAGAAVFIQEGTANADTGYVCTNDGDVTIGTDNITFTQFTGAGQLTGGDGIDITGSEISVDLDGSSLAVGASGLKVADGGIANSMIQDGVVANAKLANSTISGVALGGTLNSLSAGNGLVMTAYDGSAAVSDLTIDLNGSTLFLDGSGLKINTGGVDTNELAAAAVTTAKIADDAVTSAKIADASILTEQLDFGAFYGTFDADGSTLAFELQGPVDLNFKEMFVVTVNGLVMEYKDTPDAQDNYKIDNGGTNGVARIVFGSNLSNGDRVTIRGFANNP
jgi:hypothetical protein